MSDPLKALAAVNFLSAQFSGDELNKLADEQEQKVRDMKDVREVQEYYDSIVADGVIEESEHQQLKSMMGEIGIETDSSWWVNGATDGTVQGNNNWDEDERVYLEESEENGVTAEEASKAQGIYEGFETQIDNVLEGLEDDQALLEFEIQMATNEYTTSTNQASTLEKRVTDLQNQMIGRLDG